MLTLEITGIGEILATFDMTNARIRANFGSLMEQSLQVVEAAVKEHTPIGPTRNTIESITHELEFGGDEISGSVFSNYEDQAAIATIEEGRAAGSTMPPIGAIAEWLAWAGGDPNDAYIVARLIAENGTAGHFMFQKGFEESEGRVRDIWSDILEGI